MYISLSRNKLPYTFSLFDFVDATTSTGKRNETNIAPQALFMMNSEFINERSRSFARYLLALSSGDEAGRIRRAYQIALTRNPSPEELQEDLNYIQTYAKDLTTDPSPRLDAWRSLCHLLMTSNEFNFVN